MTSPRKMVIRELGPIAEFKDAERLQRAVWGEDDPADNADLMLAIQHEGGLVAGAFDGQRLLGLIFGFPTRQADTQHSHRLAVHPDSQGLGMGTRMKWFQRDWCLQRGIHVVRWTYDPIRHGNASLNIARLGATACEYHEHYYGEMQGINAGVDSDRIVAEWHLQAGHVKRLAQGANTSTRDDSRDRSVEIPRDFEQLVSNDRDVAVAERLRVRRELTSAFDQGYRIIGFDTRTSRYRLSTDQA